MKNVISREMTRVKRTARWLFLLAGLIISPTLTAQQNVATLDHIQSSSMLNVGCRRLPPFSFTDHNGKVTGYTIAVCNMIADRPRQHLKLNSLTIHYIPVNSSERFSALDSRKVDMSYDVNTSAPERTSNVSFSENHYTTKMRIISLRKDNIQSIADLKGRTVNLTGSSRDLLEFDEASREQHPNTSTITSTTIEGTFEKIAHNESTAFFIDNILAWPLINHSKRPELLSVFSGSIGNDVHYAIMMRENDPQFVTLISNTLRDFLASPANVQLCKKWSSSWSYERLKNPSPGSCQHSH